MGQVLCGGRGKERHVYTSISNSVEIALPHQQHDKHFLIYFVVKGCPEPELSSAYWYKRKYDEVLVGCKSGRDTWTMKCVDKKWTGHIGNCSGEASVANNQMPIFSGATIAIIITVSLLIGGVVLMVSIIFTRRNKDNKSVCHIDELPYSQPTKAMEGMTQINMSMDTDNHCEKNEYTYPTNLYGQFGGPVLVSNSGLCSLHQHKACNNIYDTAVPAITNGEATYTTTSTDSLINAKYDM